MKEMPNGPLSGVKVLDLTTEVSGPFATQILGDFGADIIKVESIEGDPQRKNGIIFAPGFSSIHLSINRNKRSLSVNLKTEDGKKILKRLIKQTDIIIHNMRISAIEKLGFGYEDVKHISPEVVYCAITGFDQDGPFRHKPAFDEIIQAGSGLVNLGNRNDKKPEYVPTVLADKTAGMALVNAVLASLFVKERTGKGQYVEVPMFETMVAFTLIEHMGGMIKNPTEGTAGYARILAGGRSPYPTSDGYISMLPYTVDHWENLFRDAGFEKIGVELGISDRITRGVNTTAVYATLHKIISMKTTQEWIEICERLDIPASIVYTLEDLPSHPQLSSVKLFENDEHLTVGNMRYVRPATKFSQTPACVRSHAPGLGQDTRQILKEIGYLETEIEKMISQDIVKIYTPI